MRKPSPSPWIALAAALLFAGCDTSPPNAGFTNGPSPTVLGAEEKPAMRTDLQEPEPKAATAVSSSSASSSPAQGSTAKDETPRNPK